MMTTSVWSSTCALSVIVLDRVLDGAHTREIAGGVPETVIVAELLRRRHFERMPKIGQAAGEEVDDGRLRIARDTAQRRPLDRDEQERLAARCGIGPDADYDGSASTSVRTNEIACFRKRMPGKFDRSISLA